MCHSLYFKKHRANSIIDAETKTVCSVVAGDASMFDLLQKTTGFDSGTLNKTDDIEIYVSFVYKNILFKVFFV